jgi:hypothetical protein
MLFLELNRRQEELRRIDELRSQDFDRRRNMMSMHHNDAYNPSVGNAYHQNQAASAAYQYNNFQQNPYQNPSPLIQQSSPIDAAYTTNQVAHGFNIPSGPNQQQQQGFDRKRQRR